MSSIYLAFGPQIPLENDMYKPFLNPASPLHSIAMDVGKEAKEVMGKDPFSVVENATKLECESTENIQPHNVIVDEILYRGAIKAGLTKDSVSGALGQSVGEYPALIAAGVTNFQTGLFWVCNRSAIMADHSYKDDGETYSLAMVRNTLEAGSNMLGEICDMTGAYFSNINRSKKDDQRNNVFTISGHHLDVAHSMDMVLKPGKVRLLEQYNAAYHAPIPAMKNAAEDLGKFLAGVKFEEPQFPVYRNLDGQKHILDEMWDSLVLHLINPVLLNCYPAERLFNTLEGVSTPVKNQGILQTIMEEEQGNKATVLAIGRGSNQLEKYLIEDTVEILTVTPELLEDILQN